jgi:hypothetical protein
MRRSLAFAMGMVAGLSGCKDIDRFSTEPGQSYCGRIVSAPSVRRGFLSTVCMRMTFDARHVNDHPGALWTDDGLFAATALRPIPELSHDPLLMFTFGEGREKNFLFSADPVESDRGPAVTAVISLMHSGDAEVRLLRGAAGAIEVPPGLDGPALFGVFSPLRRQEGACRTEPDCAWMAE